MRRSCFILLYLISIFFAGCAHTIIKNDFKEGQQFNDEFNRDAGNKTAEITFKNDSKMDLEEPRVEGDSLKGKTTGYIYGDLNSAQVWEKEYSFPVSDVKRVSVVYHLRSIIPGIAIGAAGGMAIGLVFLKGSGGGSMSGTHTIPQVSGMAGAIIGILPCAILGGIIGDDLIFNFDADSPGYNELNRAQRLGLKLGYYPGFSPEIIGDGRPGDFNRITSSGRGGIELTMFYNQALSRLFSVNGEISYINAGSDEENTIMIPGSKNQDGYYTRIPVSRKSTERMGIIELASLFRLNIKRTEISPYLLAGPKVDFLFPGSSDKVRFYQEVNDEYKGQPVDISGQYSNVILGGTIGGGISTGKLLPTEIIAELRYNFDIDSRFNLHYDTLLSRRSLGIEGAQDISYYSREWVFYLGVAVPGL